jgi:hypothetical protein
MQMRPLLILGGAALLAGCTVSSQSGGIPSPDYTAVAPYSPVYQPTYQAYTYQPTYPTTYPAYSYRPAPSAYPLYSPEGAPPGTDQASGSR